MGLTTEQLLEMELWQFNAYSEAWQDRMNDSLSIAIQAAYLEAYWNSGAKHKKTLQSVLKSIQRKEPTIRKAIDVNKIAEEFRIVEEVKQKGYAQIECN